MITTRPWRLILLVAVSFCLLGAAGSAPAASNATIMNGDVQLLKSYPSFAVSTLFTFRLVASPVVTIIPDGSRVEVSGKKVVARTQEWFAATYLTGTSKFTGWIYAGELGNRRYIRLDPGVEERLPAAARGGLAESEMLADVLQALVFPAAHAQPANPAIPPPAETDPISTLLLSLAYVVIFIGSLLATKKWIFPTSNTYAFLTSLCVLLILGFISEAMLSDVIARMITK